MIFKVCLILLLVQAISAQDYCNTTLCSSGVTHIACKHNGQFAATCVNPIQNTLTQTLIDLILSSHNSWRNKIATGGQAPFAKANRMATLQWSSTLAYTATLNTKQCKMAHDQCRNTYDFKKVGQNLCGRGFSNAFEAPVTSIPLLIKSWYDEYQYATQANLNVLTTISGTGGNAIGHFTQMIHERATHVGCGLSSYVSGGFYWNLLACNYAYPNMLSVPVYTTASVAGAGCILGTNGPTYPGLCKTTEPINPNT